MQTVCAVGWYCASRRLIGCRWKSRQWLETHRALAGPASSSEARRGQQSQSHLQFVGPLRSCVRPASNGLPKAQPVHWRNPKRLAERQGSGRRLRTHWEGATPWWLAQGGTATEFQRVLGSAAYYGTFVGALGLTLAMAKRLDELRRAAPSRLMNVLADPVRISVCRFAGSAAPCRLLVRERVTRHMGMAMPAQGRYRWR